MHPSRRSLRRSMALARRHALPPAQEPQYEMQDVPRCERSLAGACVQKVVNRDAWVRALPELLMVCNEASVRHQLRAKRSGKGAASSPGSRANASTEVCVESPSTNGDDASAEDAPKVAEEQEKRRSGSGQMVLPIHSGKPLSFEYIADRLDLDDPMHGYIVRDKATGWIQGFVTVTTFTTWQQWFRFDSLADEAGLLMFDQEGKGKEALHEMGLHLTDDPAHDAAALNWWNQRIVDADGSLAKALNVELRDGDVNSEGVIWPRVAELSLLGALGCGSWLVQLIIEELEQPDSPYNYIVLQATENSVPFYESQGFVRVGAVARYMDNSGNAVSPVAAAGKGKALGGHTAASMQVPHGGGSTVQDGSVSSPYMLHTVRVGETPTVKAVADVYGLQAREVVFFNRRAHPGLVDGKTKLEEGAVLRIPVFADGVDPLGQKVPEFSSPFRAGETRSWVSYDGKPGELSQSKLWYTARDNETPMKIAKKLGVDTHMLCEVNRSTYPTIHKRSPLQKGTILRVPGHRPCVPGVSVEDAKNRDEVLTQWIGVDEQVVDKNLGPVMCYRHWAFSDDPVQLTHASYMMVRPLRKRKAKERPRADSKLAQLKHLQCAPPVPFLYNDGSKAPLKPKPEDVPSPQKIKVRIRSRAMKKEKIRIGPLIAAVKTTQGSPQQEVAGLSELNTALESRKRPLSALTPPVKALVNRKVYFTNCPLMVKGTLTAKIDAPLKTNPYSRRHKKLFNTVVRLLPKETKKRREQFYARKKRVINGVDYGHLLEHRAANEERYEEQYEYFYVLTYIPDLQWTRLAPMQQDGVFENRYSSVAGRAKWVLVPEGQGHEIDVSASRCAIVRSKAVCRTKDADEEQWAVGSR